MAQGREDEYLLYKFYGGLFHSISYAMQMIHYGQQYHRTFLPPVRIYLKKIPLFFEVMIFIVIMVYIIKSQVRL